MTCEFCGGDTVTKCVKKHHWLQDRLYIVENVEAEVCQSCGERYFHAKTLDALDQLIAGDHEVKTSLEVEVITL